MPGDIKKTLWATADKLRASNRNRNCSCKANVFRVAELAR